MSVKTALIILVVTAVVVVAGVLVAGPHLREAIGVMGKEPEGTEVRVEPARIDRLVESVQAPGLIEPHTSVAISSKVSALITELPAPEGGAVSRGDLVCKLDDKDLKAALLSAQARRDAQKFRLHSDQARLEGLQSNVEFAKRELERIQALFQSGDVSARDLDLILERVRDLETSVESTTHAISVGESSLAAAEADIQRAQDGLDNTVILAPMDGMITLLTVEVGEFVTGSTTNPGTVLMNIADMSRMVHKAEVAESDIAGVLPGQRAQLHINAYPDEVFSGTVRQIAWQRSGNLDGTGFFETEIEIDLQDRQIRSGHRANADIEIETHEGIVVPRQAIVVREIEELPDDVRHDPLVDQTKTKCNVVYRMVDGKAVCTPVRPGASDLTHRLVDSGLEEDQSVVVGPYKVLESLRHDESIRIAAPPEDEAEEDAADDAASDAEDGTGASE
jgi:HlyD family secretion protein